MLVKQKDLQEIAAGRITLIFRRWKRPTVKTGSTLRTSVGVLAIDSVEVVDEAKITRQQAQQAGFNSKQELLAELGQREGTLYRISLHHDGADPRIVLRQLDELSADQLAELADRLTKMDQRSSAGAWTAKVIRLIADHPGVRAANLAEMTGMETKRFKANVRKLKELGLTESLTVGYRLSPRGEAYRRTQS